MIPLQRLESHLDPESLRQLTATTPDGPTDFGVLQAAVEAAESEARQLAEAPAAPLDPWLEQQALVLAVERLHLRRHQPLPPDWVARVKLARAELLAARRRTVRHRESGVPPIDHDALRRY